MTPGSDFRHSPLLLHISTAARKPPHSDQSSAVWTGSRMIVSITTPDRIDALRKFLDEMKPSHRPIGAVLPLSATLGLPGGS